MRKRPDERVERVSEQATATTLELFFDLVFVFALTLVTALMAADGAPTWHALAKGALILGVVWWCWVGYSWLSNVVKADEGLARVAMLAAMAAMFMIALAIPEAFEDLPGGLSGPHVFAYAYLLVRAVHLILFWIVARNDPGLRRQLVRFGLTMAGGTTMLLLAAGTSGNLQAALWLAAIAADYGGTMLIGARGWRLNSATHFAERHGLIVIIALGESIVAIGVGVTHLPISWPIIVAAFLGLTIAAALWWSYFDTHALITERALSRAKGADRVTMARSAYTFLHLPLIVGVVMLALGLKKVLNYVGGEDGHTLSDKLYGPQLWAMYGGVALFMFTYVAISWRCSRQVKPQRAVLGGLLVALVPLVAGLPALASLAVLTAMVVGLVTYEWFRYRDVRDEVRHAAHEEESEEEESNSDHRLR